MNENTTGNTFNGISNLSTLPLSALLVSKSVVSPLIVKGVLTIGELLGMTEDELLKIEGLGPKRLNFLREAVSKQFFKGTSGNTDKTSGLPLFEEANKETLITMYDLGDLYGFSDIPLSWFTFKDSLIRFLERNSIVTIGDLLHKTPEELYSISGFGIQKLNRVIDELHRINDNAEELRRRFSETDYQYQALYSKAGEFEPSDESETFVELGSRFKPLLSPLSTSEAYVLSLDKPISGISFTDMEPDWSKTLLQDSAVDSGSDMYAYLSEHSLSDFDDLKEYLPILEQSGIRTDSLLFVVEESVDCIISAFESIDAFDCFIKDLSACFPDYLSLLTVDAKKDAISKLPIPEIRDARLIWFSELAPWLTNLTLTVREVLESPDPSFALLHLVGRIHFSLHELAEVAHQAETPNDLYLQAVIECITKPSPYTPRVLTRRKGLDGDPPSTLQAIGNEFGITKERVRQIESKADRSFDFTRSKRLLLWRISLYSAAVKSDGGFFIDTDSTGLSVGGFGNIGSELLLSQAPELYFSKEAGFCTIRDLPCLSCSLLSDFSDEIHASDTIHETSVLPAAVGCNTCPFGYRASTDVIAFILVDKYGLFQADSFIGLRNNAVILFRLKPKSVAAQIRAVLYEAGCAISADEISRRIFEKSGTRVRKALIMSYMSNPQNDCILWGRSTYLLKQFAPFPVDILSDISEKAVELLAENNTPIINIGGIYGLYEKQLSERGVPSVQAFYSELRMLGDDRLLLKEYPWVCDAKTIGDKTTFARFFFSVIDSNDGIISDEYAEQLSKHAMTQHWQLNALSEFNPHVIRANGCWYNIDVMRIDYDSIEAIIMGVAKSLEAGDVISTKKIFADYESLLIQSGVESYDVLYRLLELLEGLPLKPSRIPHLVKEGSSTGKISVRDAIRSYIFEKDAPCTRDELYNTFVENRGISKTALAPSVFTGRGILEIDDGLFCKEELLNSTKDSLDEFDNSIAEQLNQLPETSDLFYQVEQVLAKKDFIPQITGFPWTRRLLRYAFEQSSRFTCVGQLKNCIVDRQKHPEINNDEDFYAAIIELHFGGRATFEDFLLYCRTYCIADNLGPDYFDAFSKITAADHSVRLETRQA